MYDHDQIAEEIDSAVDYYRSIMPEQISTLISLANADLYHGPVYLDDDNEPCSMYDDGAKPFNFVKACKEISEFTDKIEDVTVWIWNGDDEIEDEIRVEDSAREICKRLVGKELLSYI